MHTKSEVLSPFQGSKIVIIGEHFAVTNTNITHLDVNILASTQFIDLKL